MQMYIIHVLNKLFAQSKPSLHERPTVQQAIQTTELNGIATMSKAYTVMHLPGSGIESKLLMHVSECVRDCNAISTKNKGQKEKVHPRASSCDSLHRMCGIIMSIMLVWVDRLMPTTWYSDSGSIRRAPKHWISFTSHYGLCELKLFIAHAEQNRTLYT